MLRKTINTILKMDIEKYKAELEAAIYEGPTGAFHIGGKSVEEVFMKVIKEVQAKMTNEELKAAFRQTEVESMMAVAFAKWLRDNTVADGAPKLLFRPDMKRYTIEELYDLYTLITE